MLRRDEQIIHQLEFKIQKLTQKLVKVFRCRNRDLKHFTVGQIIDYCDQLVTESKKLHTPASPLLVVGGTFMITVGSVLYSVMVSRIFYHDEIRERTDAASMLANAQHLLFFEFGSFKNRVLGISGSVFMAHAVIPLFLAR